MDSELMSEAANDQSSRKRARTSAEDEETVSGSEGITRSPEFWFPDGSVILQAQSTQFRVHMSILSLHSTVFRDMFGIPQPPDGEPVVDGCPIVHVSDSADDIAIMLSSLYMRRRKQTGKIPFTLVSAWLRLGKKYDIEYQYEEARDILQIEFPSTLSEWTASDQSGYKRLEGRLRHDLLYDCIKLALDTDLLSILPAAYFHCADSPDYAMSVMSSEMREAGAPMLPLVAQRSSILGRDKIMQDIPREIYSWLKATYDVVFNLWRADVCLRLCCEAIDPYILDSLCEACGEEALDAYNTGRENIWRKLPTYFGWSSWEEVLRRS